MTLGDVVTDNAARFPDVPAYRLGRRTVTHAQLRDRAVRLVSAMATAGVRRQDRIAVLSRNSVEFGEVMATSPISLGRPRNIETSYSMTPHQRLRSSAIGVLMVLPSCPNRQRHPSPAATPKCKRR